MLLKKDLIEYAYHFNRHILETYYYNLCTHNHIMTICATLDTFHVVRLGLDLTLPLLPYFCKD
jgi:hypothetical protein